jgi:Mrp family chromosome partitioning ATPase
MEHVSAHTRIANLQVITAGSATGNFARALSSTRLRSFLRRLHGRTDLVIVSSPALPTVSDALLLGAELHNCLVVVTRGKTRRAAVQGAIDGLAMAHAVVVGTAFFSQQRGLGRGRRRVAAAPSTPERSLSEGAMERGRPA